MNLNDVESIVMIFAVVTAAFGWVWTKVSTQQRSLDEFKTFVAQQYVPRSEIKEDMKQISEKLDRLHDLFMAFQLGARSLTTDGAIKWPDGD
ncbi:MAG: hypothetical protein AAF358_13620 [Pseudomonadota bacterium]